MISDHAPRIAPLTFLSCLALSACGGGAGNDPTTLSGFAPVSGSSISTDLDPSESDSGTVSAPGVGLVAYAAGLLDADVGVDIEGRIAGAVASRAGAVAGS